MQAPVRRKQVYYVRLLWLCSSLMLSHTYVNAERQHGVYVDRNHGFGRAFFVRYPTASYWTWGESVLWQRHTAKGGVERETKRRTMEWIVERKKDVR